VGASAALDAAAGVGKITNMPATLLLRERRVLGDGRFAEIAIWRVPSAARGSPHVFKYRLAFVVDGVCVLRFDNESGKGDHKHIREREMPYEFQGPDRLVDDFWAEIVNWRAE
jgi:Family of unknown function (DUF6516)